MLDNLTGFNGSQTGFGLSHSGGTAFTPPDVDDLMGVRNGVVQNPNQDYSTAGTNIIFTTPPAASEQIWILYNFSLLKKNFISIFALFFDYIFKVIF